MTNEQLVTEYQLSGKAETLEAICNQNKGLVYMIVRDFRGAYAAESSSSAAVTESDDLIQYGYIGLIRAVRSYDPKREAVFSTVACEYIRGEISHGIRKHGRSVRLPSHMFDALNRLKELRRLISVRYGREPTRAEIEAYTRLQGKQLDNLLTIDRNMTISSLNKQVRTEAEGAELGDVIALKSDPIEEAENNIFQEQLKQTLWSMVDSLSGSGAAVVRAYFRDGLTLKEIGDELKLSASRTEVIKAHALKELGRGRYGRELRKFYEAYAKADGAAYRGSAGNYQRTGASSTERAALMRLEASEELGRGLMQRGSEA